MGPSNEATATLSVHFKFLPKEERLRRENSGWSIPITGMHPALWFPRTFTPDYADNPLIMRNNYAVLIVRNDGEVPFNAFSFLPLDTTPGAPAPKIAGAFLIKMELSTKEGAALEIIDPLPSNEYAHFPAPERLLSSPIIALPPHAEQEIRIAILGKFPALLDPERGAASEEPAKPGTYRIRASVSYAEAPAGEIKKIFSDSIEVTLTDFHIQQAKEVIRLSKANPPPPPSDP